MWRLLELGAIDGYTMTNLYEAVGMAVSEGSSLNTIILNHPERPFVNIGYHQLMEKEIDLNYAREMGFDLVRRSIGGGAILDGPWEQDYFVVVSTKSHDCPASISEFYGKFLKPTIRALGKFGLDAKVRPPNDVLTGDKKISGNGAITIEGANILAGDVLMQVPTDLMMRIIKAPSEKFKDKLAESMAQWLTSLEIELGTVPKREEVVKALRTSFEEELGTSLTPGNLSSKEKEHLEGLIRSRKEREWIFGKDLEYGRLVSGVQVTGTKVKEGVAVLEAMHKAGKLIRITSVVQDGVIRGISISGDFFTQPYIGAVSKLEKVLVGAPLEEEAIRAKINEAYASSGLKTFGATPEDFVMAIMKIKEGMV